MQELDELTITMHAERVTPGTVLFKEPARQGGKARNLYLPKPDFDALGRPTSIVVTVKKNPAS